MKYRIIFCELCHSIYTENPKDAKILGFPVVQEDGYCKICGTYLEIEEDIDEKERTAG